MSQLTSRRQSGQALVIIALVITVMMLMLGLLVDGGLDFYARRQAQNAADSAALAGVRVLANYVKNGSATYADINTAVISYSQANLLPFTDSWGGSGSQVSAYFVLSGDTALTNHTHCETLDTDAARGVKFNGTVPAGVRGIRVYTTVNFQAFFMGLASSTGQVAAGTCATAIFGASGGAALPIAVPRCYADPDDPYNARCKQTLTEDPTKVTHIILGKVSGNQLFNGNQLDAIANFNNRVGVNPRTVPPASAAWFPSDFDANYVWGPEPCGFTYSSKQAALNYIDAGGYAGQCSGFTYGSVAPTLSPVGDWVDLIFGVSGGVGGPISYAHSPHSYNPGDSILVILYQECQTVPSKSGDPAAYPPLCETVDDGTGVTNVMCNSNCRAKIVGRAWMKITSIDSNRLVAIYDPTAHLIETCVDPTKCGGPDSIKWATSIQLVP